MAEHRKRGLRQLAGYGCVFATLAMAACENRHPSPFPSAQKAGETVSRTRKDLADRSTPSPTQVTSANNVVAESEQAERAARLAFDPRGAGWSSEALSDAALQQLKRLASLASEAKDDSRIFADIAVEEFHCSHLRPTHLSEVYNDGLIATYRANPNVEAAAAQFTGPAGLRQALQQAFAALQGADESRVEFKVFRVQLEEDHLATTEAYLEAVDKTPDGSRQMTATWQCRWRRPTDSNDTPRLLGIVVTDFEETRSLVDTPLFADCTQSVLGANDSFREQLGRGLGYWLGAIEMQISVADGSGLQGIAVGDVNGDGLEDLFLPQQMGLPNRLYVQNLDGTATDRSAESGVDLIDHTQSALLVDWDNDGDQDLLLGTALGVTLMANDGKGRFTPKGAKLTPAAMVYSMSAADFDLDGDLDVYVCGYTPRTIGEKRPRIFGRPVPFHDANNGTPNVLFRSDGNWRLTNVTKQVGLDENNRRFSYASAWEDYDNDGDLDLYVANDFGRNNLYRNDGGEFQDAAASAGVEDISAGMSVSWGDYNGDGWMDLYVSNMFSSAGNRVAFQRRFQPKADAAALGGMRRHARGNSLFLNRRDGTFEDVSLREGVHQGRWAWASRFVDLNNDSHLDLIVANGYATGEDPADL